MNGDDVIPGIRRPPPWFVCPTPWRPTEHPTVYRVDVENLRTDEEGHVVKIDPDKPAHHIERRDDAP